MIFVTLMFHSAFSTLMQVQLHEKLASKLHRILVCVGVPIYN